MMIAVRGIALAIVAAWACGVALPTAAGKTAQYIVSDKPAGTGQYTPGAWGMVAVGVINPTDEPVDMLAAMHFEGDTSLQFGRQFWVPAQSRRFTWYPILTPTTIAPGRTRVETKALLIDRTAAREQFIESRSGQMLEPGMLSVEPQRPITGILADSDDALARECVAAARISREYSWRLAGLSDEALPPTREMLEGIDQLVLTSDRLGVDAAGLLAIRRWLYGGGRVWIMLDQVAPETVSRLLGDAFQVQVVDRVDLTEFQMEGLRPSGTVWQGERRTFEEPVELVRVLAPGLNVTHTINGWPAAMWQSVGRGQVLFTTLGSRGWTRPRTAEDLKGKTGSSNVAAVATEALNQLAIDLLVETTPPPITPAELEKFAGDQIGYRIVGRGPVLGVLSGFCVLVLGLGVWLQRRGRLEQLGWLGPLVAIVAAVGLAGMGGATRSAVPPTVAIAQWIEAVPNADDLTLTGGMGIYNQTKSDETLGARRGGLFMPDMTGQTGTVRRMVWTDLDAWHWENLTLPAGVRSAPLSYSTKIKTPLSARATLNASGLTGQLTSGPLQDVADAIIATPSRRALAVHLGESGQFTAQMSDVLAPGQYLGGNVLSDQQRQRQAVYQALLSRPGQDVYPAQPTLLFWAAPLDLDLVIADEARQSGAALVAVPLELERPPAGTAIQIPAPFLPFQSVRGPGRSGVSATYQNREGQWIGPLFEGSETFLRFQLPTELLPLTLKEATLTIKLNAPSRTLEINGVGEGEIVALETRDSPLGVLQFDIDRPEILKLDDAGGLILGVKVSAVQNDASGSISSSGWKIDYVELQVEGEVSGGP